jgi:MATE family multidrug resistance protein
LGLALPLAAAQLAQVLMGVTGAAMMGRLGGDALAAGGLASGLYFTVAFVFQGILNAAGPLAAHAIGSGHPERVGPIVASGLYIAAVLALVGVFLVLEIEPLLAWIGHAPPLVAATGSYLRAAVFGLPAGLGFALYRSYLAASARTGPVMTVLLCCLALNFLLNDLLIFGHLGLPALGVAGSGYAAAAVQWVEFLGLVLYAVLLPGLRRHRIGAALRRPDWGEARAILKLGWPIGGIIATEVGIFSTAGLLAGLLGTDALAGHQVAIGLVGFTFMVPLSFSQAATVRVALASGAGRLEAARRAGRVAFVCGVGFMALTAILIVVEPEAIIAVYLDTADPANAKAILVARRLLTIAAIFQIFDGTQSIAVGALRGLKDTRVPMLIGAIGYWAIGFPTGWLLAFPLGLGAPGLWWGLAAGLAAVGVPLAFRFHRLASRLPEPAKSP